MADNDDNKENIPMNLYLHHKISEEKLIPKLRIENCKVNQQQQQKIDSDSQFMLPSEFQNQWRELVQSTIPELFIDFISYPILYLNLVQEFMLSIFEEASKEIQNKYNQFYQILNIKNQQQKKQVEFGFKQFLQQFCKQAFNPQTEIYKKIKINLKLVFTKCIDFNYSSFQENSNSNKNFSYLLQFDKEEFNFQNYNMQQFIDSYFKICLYILLHNEISNINLPLIQKFEERKFDYVLYEKNKYIVIDGFEDKDKMCLIIVPAIKRRDFDFLGIQSGVIILNEEWQQQLNSNKTITQSIKQNEENQILTQNLAMKQPIEINSSTQSSSTSSLFDRNLKKSFTLKNSQKLYEEKKTKLQEQLRKLRESFSSKEQNQNFNRSQSTFQKSIQISNKKNTNFVNQIDRLKENVFQNKQINKIQKEISAYNYQSIDYFKNNQKDSNYYLKKGGTTQLKQYFENESNNNKSTSLVHSVGIIKKQQLSKIVNMIQKNIKKKKKAYTGLNKTAFNQAQSKLKDLIKNDKNKHNSNQIANKQRCTSVQQKQKLCNAKQSKSKQTQNKLTKKFQYK